MKFFLLIFFLFTCSVGFSQSAKEKAKPADPETDSLYCISYTKMITGRIYLSQKYTRLNFTNPDDNYDLSYRPNTTLNFGIGATYKWATLNLAYGFPFLNPDNGQGKTNYLDLQAHFYGKKFTVDLFGSFYKGFFLNPRGKLAPENEYYKRPDLRVNEIGTSVQYVFNHKKFSYRASFLQNEWQKKSCGSIIAGAEIHLGRLAADSAMIPREVNSEFQTGRINRFDYFEIGPNLGYAYTLVIKRHFFLTGSLAYSFDFGVNTTRNTASKVKNNGFTPNNTIRIFAGYNSELNAFSLVFVNSNISLTNQKDKTSIDLDTGNFRLNYVRRFKPGKKAREVLKHL